jgi:hypothetical protein
MKNKNEDKIIYSICNGDIQQVANEKFGRNLKQNELKIVENEIGDYFAWYDSIESCLRDKIFNNEDDKQTTPTIKIS